MAECVAALGFFDGVHLGHGALLRRTRELADQYSCEAVAVTFDRHPASVVTGREERLISSPGDRALLMQTLFGIDRVAFLHFGRTLMQMPWEEFLDTFLAENNVVHAVCGWDYSFGRRGEGTAELLRSYCARHGIGCDIIPELRLNGNPVHSTIIREQILAGRLDEAAALMGHPWLVTGTVTSGRHLGVPAELASFSLELPAHILLPPPGVYAAEAILGDACYSAVLNLPEQSSEAELRIPELQENCTGRNVHLFLRSFLRPERSFPSAEAFAEALRADEAAAMRSLLS